MNLSLDRGMVVAAAVAAEVAVVGAGDDVGLLFWGGEKGC